MNHPKFSEHGKIFKLALASVVALALAVGVYKASAVTSYNEDAPLLLTGSGISLVIKAGSSVRQISAGPSSFSIKLTHPDTFSVFYPGPQPGRFVNDAGFPECDLVDGGNLLVVNGPVEATVTPSAEPCPGEETAVPASSSSSGGNRVILTYPNGGEVFESGSVQTIGWQSAGNQIKKVDLVLSLDGGATFLRVVAERLPDSGYFAWTVPASLVSTAARFMVEGLSADGRVLATDASDHVFVIKDISAAEGPAPVETAEVAAETPPAEASAPATSGSTGAAPSEPLETSGQTGESETDELASAAPAHPACPAQLIKVDYSKAVYYCGSDGRRYVFPNHRVFLSWFQDFSGVLEIGRDEMAVIVLGGNVTYKPGSRLVKVNTDPRVYEVTSGRVLRWIKDEAAAVKLFGAGWNQKVDDLPESLFSDYSLGEPVE